MSATHFQLPSACFFQISSVLPRSVAWFTVGIVRRERIAALGIGEVA